MRSGIRSSRKPEEACRYRLDFIWLVEGRKIDHTTFNKFRTRFRDGLKDLCRQIGRTAMALGLIQLGVVTFDGTRVKANNSRCQTHGQDLGGKTAGLGRIVRAVDGAMNATDSEQAGESSPTRLTDDLADLEERRARMVPPLATQRPSQ